MKQFLYPLLFMAFCCPSLSEAQNHPKQENSTRPNIIFILVDDQGFGDLGVFFQNQRSKENDRSKPVEYSPNLDKMASEGAILINHYCAAPVCAPSRASIMLGVSQGHANVRNNQFDKALEDNYTMPGTLRKLGYSTAIIGKWGLQGDNQFDKNGSLWPAHPLKRGFDYSFSYMRHKDGHEHYPKEGLYDGPKEVWENYSNVASGLDKCYTADLWTAVAKKYIVDHLRGNESDRPFFLYLAYETPHAVLELPTEKYPTGGGLKGGIQWIGTPGHMINTAEGKVDSYVYSGYESATYDDDHNLSTPEVPWPDTYKRYATANRRIDNAVGDIRKLLEDLRIDSNTVVIYTSDNGASVESYLPKQYVPFHPTFFDSNGPFDGIKRDDWEGGVRMPAIVSWPGHIPAGKVIASPSISYDWAPTLINIAGEAAPQRMDGVSLLPCLTGKGKLLNRIIYNEYYFKGKTPDFMEYAANHRGRRRNQMQWVRTGSYVGVRYDVKSSGDDFEIYNVVKDPQQKDNLMLKAKEMSGVIRIPDSKESKRIKIYQLDDLMKTRVLQMRRPNSSARRPYDSTFIPAITSNVKPGVAWKEFAGNILWIPQVETQQFLKKGKAARPQIKSLQNKKDVILFQGYINIPTDGRYTFYLKADGKAFLRLHDAQVIDADFGYKGDTEKSASILLKEGLHPFSLYYMGAGKSEFSMDFEWSGPGIGKKLIPGNKFFIDK